MGGPTLARARITFRRKGSREEGVLELEFISGQSLKAIKEWLTDVGGDVPVFARAHLRQATPIKTVIAVINAASIPLEVQWVEVEGRHFECEFGAFGVPANALEFAVSACGETLVAVTFGKKAVVVNTQSVWVEPELLALSGY